MKIVQDFSDLSAERLAELGKQLHIIRLFLDIRTGDLVKSGIVPKKYLCCLEEGKPQQSENVAIHISKLMNAYGYDTTFKNSEALLTAVAEDARAFGEQMQAVKQAVDSHRKQIASDIAIIRGDLTESAFQNQCGINKNMHDHLKDSEAEYSPVNTLFCVEKINDLYKQLKPEKQLVKCLARKAPRLPMPDASKQADNGPKSLMLMREVSEERAKESIKTLHEIAESKRLEKMQQADQVLSIESAAAKKQLRNGKDMPWSSEHAFRPDPDSASARYERLVQRARAQEQNGKERK